MGQTGPCLRCSSYTVWRKTKFTVSAQGLQLRRRSHWHTRSAAGFGVEPLAGAWCASLPVSSGA
eukprot:3147074-Rhodomonas_salina.1